MLNSYRFKSFIKHLVSKRAKNDKSVDVQTLRQPLETNAVQQPPELIITHQFSLYLFSCNNNKKISNFLLKKMKTKVTKD